MDCLVSPLSLIYLMDSIHSYSFIHTWQKNSLGTQRQFGREMKLNHKEHFADYFVIQALSSHLLILDQCSIIKDRLPP